MARLIKTEKEVEGRFTEQWIVVEEDALEQWPAGPLDTVGRPATKVDGLARARGEARYTQDLLLPGMLHAAVLRSPYARARVKRIDLGPALEAPGVRGAVGPDDLDVLTAEPNYEGQAVAAVAAESIEQAQAAVALIDVEWEELEPLLDPHRALEEKSFVADPRNYERGDVERGLAEADAVVEAEYTTQSVLHNALETHQTACEWEGDTLVVYTSTQYLWGVRKEVAEALGLPQDKVRVICRFMGGGFGAKGAAGDFTFIAAELAKRTGRPVHCRLTRREENVNSGNRNPTIQTLRVGARADGTLTAISGEYLCLLGWDGWLPPTAGPAQMLYACENVRTVEYGVRLNLPPMDAFRAPGYVEGTFGLECAARRARREARPRPTRAAPQEPCRQRPDGRPAVLEQAADGVLPARRAALGAPARGASALGGPVEARRRDRQPALVRRRRPALLRLGAHGRRRARDRRDRDAGHRHRHAHRDGADRRRGARASARPGDGRARRHGARPVRGRLRRVVDAAVDGPGRPLGGGRPPQRQIVEIAAQRFQLEERVLSLKGGEVVYADGGSWPLEEITGLLEDAQILGKGARGPNPTGMKTLTFGVQVAEVAVDVETGEVRGRPHRRRPRRRARDQPARRARARSRAGSSRRSDTR